MTENKENSQTGWHDPEDVPDLTSSEWAKALDEAPVRRGRPKSPTPKVATTLRLDPEVVAHFRAGGPGWQTRINETLRKAVGLQDQ